MNGRHFILAITGASGTIYGLRLGGELLENGARLSLLISRAGFAVLKEECGLDWGGSAAEIQQELCVHFRASGKNLRYYAEDDLSAPIASGSAAAHAMIVAPCSMGTLSRIACGNSGNLIERCADVMLKERRTLVVVPRETPLHEVHLENMLRLSRLGARLVPAMPAFYHKPESLDDMVNFVVGKALDMLGVEHRLFKRWGDNDSEQ
ncbi:MAG: UbiX family flavin prenyltransferase [Geobacteraceae bacterium]|nr:UbiX family flavin prenyltransferase [Geobacteraceae bacterium]